MTDFNEGKGDIWGKLVSQGESISNYIWHPGGCFTHFRRFPSYKLDLCRGGVAKLHLIKYSGRVMVLLIKSLGNNGLINDCLGGR